MHRFIDTLWRPVCAYVLPGWWPAYWQSGWNDIATTHYCLERNDVKPQPGAGSLRVLGAGRLGLLAPAAQRRHPADVAGMFLNDPKVPAQMKEQYWDRLWSRSSAAAISGSETSNCYFK